MTKHEHPILIPNTAINQANTQAQRANQRYMIDNGKYTDYLHYKMHQFRTFIKMDMHYQMRHKNNDHNNRNSQ